MQNDGYKVWWKDSTAPQVPAIRFFNHEVLEFCNSVLLTTKTSHLSSHSQVLESKVEFFLALACWLMTSCSSRTHIAALSKRTRAADQSVDQSYALAITRGIYWKNNLELHSNHFWNDCHCGIQRLTLVFLTQHVSLCQCIHAKGKGFFVWRSICSTHGIALIYASDAHAGANELFFSLNVPRKETHTIPPFLFFLFSLSFFHTEVNFSFNVSFKDTLKRRYFPFFLARVKWSSHKCSTLISGEDAATSHHKMTRSGPPYDQLYITNN